MEPDPQSTDDLITLLRARGQRVTSQRLVILRELRRRGRHITAQDVADAVRDELPATSVPTIHATLDLLADLGLVRKLSAGTGARMYDARADPHEHAVCRLCGRVEDLDGELDASAPIAVARTIGFAPDHTELIVSGLCARCAQTTAEP